jgi:hypothetical protein
MKLFSTLKKIDLLITQKHKIDTKKVTEIFILAKKVDYHCNKFL